MKWRETTIPFEKRMEKYSRYSFLPQHLEARSLDLQPVLISELVHQWDRVVGCHGHGSAVE